MSALEDPPDIRLSLVGLDDTFALRKAVLRPWLTPETSRAAFAETPERFHVGAVVGDAGESGPLISTASFTIESQTALDDLRGTAPDWRLRAMATDPAFQGRGLGGQVLSFGIAELARRLGARGAAKAMLWCNGRTKAQGFYQRHGFAPIGEIFETPGTGPHYVFWRRVTAAR